MGCMRSLLRVFIVFVSLAVPIMACSSGGTPTGGRPQGQGASQTSSGPKTLLAAVNEDPKNWWDGVNGGGGGGSRELSHFVNQYLASIGPDGTPSPRLLTE